MRRRLRRADRAIAEANAQRDMAQATADNASEFSALSQPKGGLVSGRGGERAI